MDEEKIKSIVEMVTQELMRLREKESASALSTPVKEESVLIVFTGGTAEKAELGRQLTLIREKYRTLGLWSPSAEKVLGKEWINQFIDVEVDPAELMDNISSVDTMIFPTLTQNTAAKAAAGIRDSLASEALACGLIMSKRVVAPFNSICPEGLPPAYHRLCSRIIADLTELGMNLCDAGDLAQEMETSGAEELNETSHPDTPEVEETAAINDIADFSDFKLIDTRTFESVVVRETRQIEVSQKALITPMVMDFIRDRGIEIVRKQG